MATRARDYEGPPGSAIDLGQITRSNAQFFESDYRRHGASGSSAPAAWRSTHYRLDTPDAPDI